MGKKLSSNIDYFEGYQLLGIVSQLRDYSLAFFINKSLDIELKKYEDMDITDNEGGESAFSWYFYKDEHQLRMLWSKPETRDELLQSLSKV